MNYSPDIRRASASTDRRPLGRSGVMVTPCGFGGAGIGNLYRSIPDAEAIGAVRHALDAGMNFIDTAPYYGFGLSERRIGIALREWNAPVVLSTKVGRVLVPAPDAAASAESRHGFHSAEPFEPQFDYSYDGVLRSYESSLERLRVERIDVLLCHDIGAVTHREHHGQRLQSFLDGGCRAMRRLRDEGAVGAIGLGVNEWEVCVRVLQSCDLDCVLLAGRYTLLEQGALETLFPLCARRHVSIIVGGPFNSGILATGAAAQAHYNYGTAPADIVDRVQRIATLCEQFHVPVPAAALQFPLAHPQVAAVVPGCSSIEEVKQVSRWIGTAIPSGLWESLRAANLLDASAPVPS